MKKQAFNLKKKFLHIIFPNLKSNQTKIIKMKVVIIFQFHAVGYEAAFSRPQVFPKANLIYPYSPHDVFHEFLTIQASAV